MPDDGNKRLIALCLGSIRKSARSVPEVGIVLPFGTRSEHPMLFKTHGPRALRTGMKTKTDTVAYFDARRVLRELDV